MMRLLWFAPFGSFILLSFLQPSLQAHQYSESYLGVNVKGKSVLGHWDIALRDLAHVLSLSENAATALTWEELGVGEGEVENYTKANVQFRINDIERPLSVTRESVRLFVDGSYAVIEFEVENPLEPYTVEFTYNAIFDQDPQHRCLYLLESVGGDETGVLTAEHRSQDFELSKPDLFRQFKEFVVQGVWHIWKGFDHVLFLLALLLPSVLLRKEGRWKAVEAFRPAAISIVKIVTAFTVAHSITLTLASLNLVKLPARPVEAAIAFSVAVAAGNNLIHFFRGRAWLVAFCFGLVHGFGFASVLQELGLPPGSLARALVGFNLGVEAGQLAIVAGFLPVAYVMRGSRVYRHGMVTAGSVGIVIIASAWMVDRAFGLWN